MATMDDPPIPPIRNVSTRDKEPAKNGSRPVDKKAGFFKKDKKSAGGMYCYSHISSLSLSLSLSYTYIHTHSPSSCILYLIEFPI